VWLPSTQSLQKKMNPACFFFFLHRDEARGYNISRSYKYNRDREDLEPARGQHSDCNWAGGRILKANTNLSGLLLKITASVPEKSWHQQTGHRRCLKNPGTDRNGHRRCLKNPGTDFPGTDGAWKILAPMFPFRHRGATWMMEEQARAWGEDLGKVLGDSRQSAEGAQTVVHNL
jgi:hypothetical protein